MQDFYIFLLTSLIIALTPGPSMIFSLNQSRRFNKIIAYYSLLGLSCGLFIYAVALAFGLSIFFSTYPLIYKIIKIIGLLYILYLAYTSLPLPKKISFNSNVLQKKRKESFAKGLMLSIVNPKFAIFFCIIIPEFVTSSVNLFLYGLIFNVIVIVVYAFIILMADKFFKTVKSNILSYIPSVLFLIIAGNIFYNI